MAQTDPLIDTLKRALKAGGRTYADVAVALGLSEASVKRLFAERSFSLHRIDRICQLLEIEISDLVQQMNADVRTLSKLTEEQEAQIAGDPTLLLVTVCVLNRWTFDDIVTYYAISETQCIRYLAKLDRLKIAELLAHNRIRLRIATNFHWREGGPIQQFFQANVEREFFSSRFDHSSEQLIVLNGMLTAESNAVFQRKLERLARDFNELNDQDAALPVTDRDGTTVVLAMRQWEYQMFENLRRRG